MQTETITRNRTSKNMTVKLEDSERERVKSIAIAKQRTPHYIMREAIRNYLNEEEAEQRFIAVAKESLEEFKKDEKHITLDEFSGWVRAKKSNPKALMPLCHK